MVVFKGVCARINPDNGNQKILRISFRNTNAHNRCRIIGGSERSYDSLMDSFPYKVYIMFMIDNLIEPHMELCRVPQRTSGQLLFQNNFRK